MTLAQKLTRLSVALINSPTQLQYYQDRIYPFTAPREVHTQNHIIYYPMSHELDMLDGREFVTRTVWELIFREPVETLNVESIAPVLNRVEQIMREIISSLLPVEMRIIEFDTTRLSDAVQILSVKVAIADDTGHA